MPPPPPPPPPPSFDSRDLTTLLPVFGVPHDYPGGAGGPGRGDDPEGDSGDSVGRPSDEWTQPLTSDSGALGAGGRPNDKWVQTLTDDSGGGRRLYSDAWIQPLAGDSGGAGGPGCGRADSDSELEECIFLYTLSRAPKALLDVLRKAEQLNAVRGELVRAGYTAFPEERCGAFKVFVWPHQYPAVMRKAEDMNTSEYNCLKRWHVIVAESLVVPFVASLSLIASNEHVRVKRKSVFLRPEPGSTRPFFV